MRWKFGFFVLQLTLVRIIVCSPSQNASVARSKIIFARQWPYDPIQRKSPHLVNRGTSPRLQRRYLHLNSRRSSNAEESSFALDSNVHQEFELPAYGLIKKRSPTKNEGGNGASPSYYMRKRKQKINRKLSRAGAPRNEQMYTNTDQPLQQPLSTSYMAQQSQNMASGQTDYQSALTSTTQDEPSLRGYHKPSVIGVYQQKTAFAEKASTPTPGGIDDSTEEISQVRLDRQGGVDPNDSNVANELSTPTKAELSPKSMGHENSPATRITSVLGEKVVKTKETARQEMMRIYKIMLEKAGSIDFDPQGQKRVPFFKTRKAQIFGGVLFSLAGLAGVCFGGYSAYEFGRQANALYAQAGAASQSALAAQMNAMLLQAQLIHAGALTPDGKQAVDASGKPTGIPLDTSIWNSAQLAPPPGPNGKGGSRKILHIPPKSNCVPWPSFVSTYEKKRRKTAPPAVSKSSDTKASRRMLSETSSKDKKKINYPSSTSQEKPIS